MVTANNFFFYTREAAILEEDEDISSTSASSSEDAESDMESFAADNSLSDLLDSFHRRISFNCCPRKRSGICATLDTFKTLITKCLRLSH